MPKGIQIFGKRLAKARKSQYMNQPKLALLAKMSVENVKRLEKGEITSTDPENVPLLAMALGMSLPDFERDILVGADEPANPDHNVEPYSTQIIGEEIPLFDLPLAAGGWVEIDGDDDGEAKRPGVCHSPDQVTRGLFRVRLRGDSMLPAYVSGDVVEFLCVRQDRDGPEAGRDYYVHLSDGTATFKRCEGVTDEALHLRALNKRKYPKLMTVSRGLIVRMARAVAKVSILE